MGSGSGVVVACGIGHRCGLDLELLWLWYRLAVAALIQPLAWELPYTMGVVLKRPKKKKKVSDYGPLFLGSSEMLRARKGLKIPQPLVYL